ncbi:efflux RND transporter periplasmic adaptor subunit [Pseudoduganella violacea]|uniref:HlyD family secretion protein n=1 Tax=Pseudoduganella violacea TaxID=1715466 RepID=A0A7W5BFS9_9BURK|nr:efflux RND transporter periplasmic adaptor subunit [Pseudoduganella violacea]MBB3122356.1 HlyD family secretion protein [Pseudoduganella violacea]
MKIFTKKRLAVLITALVVVGGASAVLFQNKPAEAPQRYRTAAVDSGNIAQLVTASGTINPVALVNVGSQVSGTVSELNADFNDRVKKGQILLKLEPTIFEAQIRQAEASLASAEASMRLAQATFTRNQTLVSQNYVSTLALDQSKREVDVAKANIELAKAQLARARADLNNSVIRAPIDGVIIKRTIDLGQTVAASFNTPNLFQIARDLTKMQIDTNVSEADVGMLKEGQPARFVVDAYPDKEFDARMRQFRLAPNVVQNVVTYNVVLDVDNKDELLKPGMTAQVRLVVGDRQNVLRIPTAALRFRLSDEELAAEQKKQAKAAAKDGKAASASAKAAAPVAAPEEDSISFRSKGDIARTFKVYRLDEHNEAKPVDVRIGLSNFRYTEILDGGLKKGDKVITRKLAGEGKDNGEGNP